MYSNLFIQYWCFILYCMYSPQLAHPPRMSSFKLSAKEKRQKNIPLVTLCKMASRILPEAHSVKSKFLLKTFVSLFLSLKVRSQDEGDNLSLSMVWVSDIDYKPLDPNPMLRYLSPWLKDIYKGRFNKFMRHINKYVMLR